jgi:hypothetical protein
MKPKQRRRTLLSQDLLWSMLWSQFQFRLRSRDLVAGYKARMIGPGIQFVLVSLQPTKSDQHHLTLALVHNVPID